jgi:4'-phosphopantetheinyl transferase
MLPEIKKYMRWQDRQNHLFSKLLLRKALNNLNLPIDLLETFSYSKNGKPYVGGTVEFSMSHSWPYAVIAVSIVNKIGIDIEKVQQNIDLNNFIDIFTKKEIQAINQSKDVGEIFFKIWTRKESFLKAIGTGFLIAPKQFACLDKVINHDGKKWSIYDIKFQNDIAISLATELEKPSIKVDFIPLDNILNGN